MLSEIFFSGGMDRLLVICPTGQLSRPCSISSGYENLEIRISMGYVVPMIRTVKGKFAESILQGRTVPKGFPADLAKVSRRKLIMVDAAAFLEALNSPPGNRLEALKGRFGGQALVPHQ
jgi:plasmid maintenance system killer protein